MNPPFIHQPLSPGHWWPRFVTVVQKNVISMIILSDSQTLHSLSTKVQFVFHFHFILQTDITGLVCLSIIYKFQIFQQRQIMLMEDLYSIVHGVLFLAYSSNEGSGAPALMKWWLPNSHTIMQKKGYNASLNPLLPDLMDFIIYAHLLSFSILVKAYYYRAWLVKRMWINLQSISWHLE
jgi:hypothetical protein